MTEINDSDDVDDADIEDFQYGMLTAFVELSKKHKELNLSPTIIEGIRALNYLKKQRKKKKEEK